VDEAFGVGDIPHLPCLNGRAPVDEPDIAVKIPHARRRDGVLALAHRACANAENKRREGMSGSRARLRPFK